MLDVLILCTGNSCRSILAEALVNHIGRGRLRAYSAGSHPVGKVNPHALATLQRNGIATDGLRSKSWDEFDGKGVDIVITVCDRAAAEVCPTYLEGTVRAYWDLPDPALARGDEANIQQAFQTTYDALQVRVSKMLDLALEDMTQAEIIEALTKIHQQTA
jgi:arsenate reductase (thioredoxin)